MGVGRRQRAIRAMRGQMWSPGRPSIARREDRVRFWEAIARGASSEDAAGAAGVSQAVGSRWFRQAGGMPPISLAPVSERYLSFAEREEIAILHAQKRAVRSIARRLGRSPSTISRELRRNASTRSHAIAYRAATAQWHAERRASRPKVSKLAANDALRTYVQDRLAGAIARPDGSPAAGPEVRWVGRRRGRRTDRRWASSWSPEQIANRLRVDFPDDPSMRISYEAIYQSLYVQGRGALRRGLARTATGRSPRTRSASRDHRGSRRGAGWRSALGSTSSPSADRCGDHGDGRPSAPQAPQPGCRRVWRSRRRDGPAHTSATRRSRPASKPSGGSLVARHATALSSRGTRSSGYASTRYGATPSRSSTATDRAGERSHAPPPAGREEARSLPAQQTTDSAPTAGPTRSAASRHRRGTTGCQPLATRPPPRPPPRSTVQPRSPARTAADPPAAPPTAGPATTSDRASLESPADACQHPSRTTSITRCCDHQLNPPSTRASPTPTGSTSSAPRPRSGRAATPTTTRWPKPGSRASRANSSTGVASPATSTPNTRR